MPPALQAPVVDMQALTGLAAARADPSSPAQGDGHDHPLRTKADVDDGRSGQAEYPLECGLDAHAVPLCGRLSFITRQPASRTAARPSRTAQLAGTARPGESP